MRIALLSDWYLPRLGGLELHIRDLAVELTAAGCQVHVITPTRAAPDQQARSLPTAVLPDPPGVVVHRLGAPLLPIYKFAYTPAMLTELSALLRRQRFDVVHAMVGVVSPAALGGVWAARRLRLPTVVTFHSMLFGFRHVLRTLDVLGGWSRWPLLLSAVSEVVAGEARPLARGRAVHVLPNGVHPEAWRVRPVPPPPGELRLVSVMRLNPRKRGAALLRAVARARAALGGQARLRLTLVGDGPEAPRLRRLAGALGLGDAVRFTGYLPRDAVRGVLAHADAFVLASRLESFGIAALEARAAGVPVVALDHGGIKEFVRHGRDGLLAGSDAELAAHLVRLAREPELLAALGWAARQDPLPFSWDHTTRRHLAAYRAALEAVAADAARPVPGSPRRLARSAAHPARARPEAVREVGPSPEPPAVRVLPPPEPAGRSAPPGA